MADLIFKTGDILSSGIRALVNPVNCHGVMGAGLAKQFKIKYPDMFVAYAYACRSGIMTPGSVHAYTSVENDITIFNIATKDHWRNESRLEWVDTGLTRLAEMLCGDLYRPVLGIPAIGCGLGGLKWTDVSSLIISRLEDVPNVSIHIFAPRIA